MAKKPRRNYMAQADKVYADIIKAEGRCENCGTTERLQCAHIVERQYMATRLDLDNAVCLCSGCHKTFTHAPIEWRLWVDEQYGPMFRHNMEAKALNGKGQRRDYKARLAELVDIAHAIGVEGY